MSLDHKLKDLQAQLLASKQALLKDVLKAKSKLAISQNPKNNQKDDSIRHPDSFSNNQKHLKLNVNEKCGEGMSNVGGGPSSSSKSVSGDQTFESNHSNHRRSIISKEKNDLAQYSLLVSRDVGSSNAISPDDTKTLTKSSVALRNKRKYEVSEDNIVKFVNRFNEGMDELARKGLLHPPIRYSETQSQSQVYSPYHYPHEATIRSTEIRSKTNPIEFQEYLLNGRNSPDSNSLVEEIFPTDSSEPSPKRQRVLESGYDPSSADIESNMVEEYYKAISKKRNDQMVFESSSSYRKGDQRTLDRNQMDHEGKGDDTDQHIVDDKLTMSRPSDEHRQRLKQRLMSARKRGIFHRDNDMDIITHVGIDETLKEPLELRTDTISSTIDKSLSNQSSESSEKTSAFERGIIMSGETLPYAADDRRKRLKKLLLELRLNNRKSHASVENSNDLTEMSPIVTITLRDPEEKQKANALIETATETVKDINISLDNPQTSCIDAAVTSITTKDDVYEATIVATDALEEKRLKERELKERLQQLRNSLNSQRKSNGSVDHREPIALADQAYDGHKDATAARLDDEISIRMHNTHAISSPCDIIHEIHNSDITTISMDALEEKRLKLRERLLEARLHKQQLTCEILPKGQKQLAESNNSVLLGSKISRKENFEKISEKVIPIDAKESKLLAKSIGSAAEDDRQSLSPLKEQKKRKSPTTITSKDDNLPEICDETSSKETGDDSGPSLLSIGGTSSSQTALLEATISKSKRKKLRKRQRLNANQEPNHENKFIDDATLLVIPITEEPSPSVQDMVDDEAAAPDTMTDSNPQAESSNQTVSLKEKLQQMQQRLLESKEAALRNVLLLRLKKNQKNSNESSFSSSNPQINHSKPSVSANMTYSTLKDKNRKTLKLSNPKTFHASTILKASAMGMQNVPMNRNKSYKRPDLSISPSKIIQPFPKKGKDKDIIQKLLTIVRKQKEVIKMNKEKAIKKPKTKSNGDKKKEKIDKRQLKNCMFYVRAGVCRDGDSCPYRHDVTMIHICNEFLKNSCNQESGKCLLCHELDPERIPDCKYFLQGKCSKSDCRYRHNSSIKPDTEICNDFNNGRCKQGLQCPERHEYKDKLKKQSHDSTEKVHSTLIDSGKDVTLESNDNHMNEEDPSAETEGEGLPWFLDLKGDKALFVPLPDMYDEGIECLQTSNSDISKDFKRYYS